MADQSGSSSFIPKRNSSSKNSRQRAKRQVYVFTIVSYAAIFAALLAAAAVFLYQSYVESQLNDRVQTLNQSIQSFSESDMARVTELDARLKYSERLVQGHVSLSSILETLEDATLQSAQLTSFTVNRPEDDSLVVSGAVLTDSFDSVLFQREVLNNSTLSSSTEIADVSITRTNQNPESAPSASNNSDIVVSFTIGFTVPANAFPYEPVTANDSFSDNAFQTPTPNDSANNFFVDPDQNQGAVVQPNASTGVGTTSADFEDNSTGTSSADSSLTPANEVSNSATNTPSV